MKETTVLRDDLLGALKRNRAKHEETYRKARKEWLKRSKKELTKRLRKFTNEEKRLHLDFSDLPKPQHFLKHYDTAIEQLQWETEEKVVLTDAEFRQYVQDDWTWRNQFIGTTSTYLAE